MEGSLDRRIPLTRTLLLAMLMVAQSVLLVHEIDHLSASDTTLCAVCQVGHNLAGPSNATAAPVVFFGTAPVIVAVDTLFVYFVFSRPIQARAPPQVLFSILTA